MNPETEKEKKHVLTTLLAMGALIFVVVTSSVSAATQGNNNMQAMAQPSKPNQIRWCIDVVLYDFDGIGILHATSCGETKKDCRHNQERELAQVRTISVSECYKQKIDKPPKV